MPAFLCLIADPAQPVLDGDLLERVRVHLGLAAPPEWLAEGIAAEFVLEESDDQGAVTEARTREVLDHNPVDVAVVPSANRRKKLLLADMDSTIIGQECIDELADFVGLKAEVAAITERAMQGELPFEDALRERVALLKGLRSEVVSEILEHRITLNPGAGTLVRTMRAHGAYAALVSGGFTSFTSAIAARAGFDEHRANDLVSADGVMTGMAVEPIRGQQAKLDALRELIASRGIEPVESMAVGDGANDVPMVEAAGLGVAYHAKPALAAVADAGIVHGDLTALLYLQGYRREEFVR